MEREFEQMKKEIEELMSFKRSLLSYDTIPDELVGSLISRGFIFNNNTGTLNGVLIGNKTSPMNAKLGKESSTFYVATVPGGAAATGVTVEDGVIITAP